ncbi:hypothetical protein C347_05021 [Cryptococcus neoformans AD2-60a]|uniref:Uncharacterized protein n=1 Tax=Cryptococcus neoformans Tu259-1 TaxID=1230072 RepID=A0A854Q883_CRYNE|nr:hypothetical protein C347_05021 [Cryptococcus neoformans var. grubii AD2-60a]OWZ36158.1 hypothetical protein C353_04872 [Cryptococcus neoformans var. grubii AD1-83a]OWZ52091.1 hypothetical protein C368_05131 [Cryptococcus neoformans var. grubii 125.91]OXG15750.1 hypothetical protein C361_05189 [Cryptococcus neoformans var. grubii Tu259-1]OXG53721.1 hypothetical protein C354_04809 [Cryptococcus neoformans var. grubii MW-RSA1955]OXG57111.1 hypothetical protein C352_04789 [Cryptococcus neoform
MDRTSPRKGPRRGDGENRGSFLKSEPAARVLQVLNLGQATLNKNNRYGTPTMAQRSKAIVFLIATAMYASSIVHFLLSVAPKIDNVDITGSYPGGNMSTTSSSTLYSPACSPYTPDILAYGIANFPTYSLTKFEMTQLSTMTQVKAAAVTKWGIQHPPSSLLPMATYSLPPSWKKHYGFWDENDTL